MTARSIIIAWLAWVALTNAAAAHSCCRATARACADRPCAVRTHQVRPAQRYVISAQPAYAAPSCYMQRERIWDTFHHQWVLWTNRVCE